MGDEHLSEHFGGEILRLGGGVAEMDAALESVLEGSLAAATCVDLRLDDQLASAQSRRDRLGLRGCVGDLPGLGGDAEFCKKFTGLEFVDVHREKGISTTNIQAPFEGKELLLKRAKISTLGRLLGLRHSLFFRATTLPRSGSPPERPSHRPRSGGQVRLRNHLS